jgi:hypothetical protein
MKNFIKFKNNTKQNSYLHKKIIKMQIKIS